MENKIEKCKKKITMSKYRIQKKEDFAARPSWVIKLLMSIPHHYFDWSGSLQAVRNNMLALAQTLKQSPCLRKGTIVLYDDNGIKVNSPTRTIVEFVIITKEENP